MKQRLNEIKHILWDWNGTLINDAEYCSEIISSLLYKHGLNKISINEYRDLFCFPVERFYDLLGLKGRGVSFEETSRSFIEEYQKGWFNCALHKNAEFVLREIDAFGIKQSVVTAGDKRLIGNYVSHFGISHYFESLNGTDNILAAGKIDVAINYMRRESLDGSNVILIGDTVHDEEVAKEIDSSVLLYAHGHNSKDKLMLNDTTVINNLADVLDFLK